MLPSNRARELLETEARDLRRSPRYAQRCRVELRDRFGTWTGETEDVGPRGCRVVMPRPQTVGAIVRLTLASDRFPAVLETAGQVVWAQNDRPAHAGILFTGSVASGSMAPAEWVEALAAATGGDRPRSSAGREDGARPPGASSSSRGESVLAQRLLERARELVVAGDAATAQHLLRRARAVAPGDAEIENAIRRLGR